MQSLLSLMRRPLTPMLAVAVAAFCTFVPRSDPASAGVNSHWINAVDRKVLCLAALDGSRTDWEWPSTAFKEAVAEAENRKLSIDDCRIALGLSRLSVIDTKLDLTNNSWSNSVDRKVLCLAALNSNRTAWETGSSTAFKEAVAEAEIRGLSIDECRIALGLSRLSVIDTKLDLTNTITKENFADLATTASAEPATIEFNTAPEPPAVERAPASKPKPAPDETLLPEEPDNQGWWPPRWLFDTDTNPTSVVLPPPADAALEFIAGSGFGPG